jgi:glutamate---cysteine ligase / carboxylate-amine ligase
MDNSSKSGIRTFGVEEELLLVDPGTGEAIPLAAGLLDLYLRPQDSLAGPILMAEFQQEMIESVTPPHAGMDALLTDIIAGRAIAAMAAEYGLTAREHLTCGCHIHVSVESPEEGIAVLDRIRIWLPVLIALSANSPFWHGQDTGYASYRSQVWNRWPSAGPVEILGSPAAYHQLVHDMVSTGVALDEGMIYFDARLSRHYPTVEIRIADVCLRPENTALLAGIARGSVETAAREWRRGIEPVAVPSLLLRLAGWKASRWGLRGELLDPVTSHPQAALAVVNALLNHVREALADIGDLQRVEQLIDNLLHAGTGASRQLEVLHRTGQLEDVVADAINCTVWVQ